jgi:hypothetical protein
MAVKRSRSTVEKRSSIKNSLCSSVKTRMEMDLPNNSSSSHTSNPNAPKKRKSATALTGNFYMQTLKSSSYQGPNLKTEWGSVASVELGYNCLHEEELQWEAHRKCHSNKINSKVSKKPKRRDVVLQ